MKGNVAGLGAVFLVVVAGAAHAASKTIIMNSIDANGIGNSIGTLGLSDTKAGLRSGRGSLTSRRASMGSMFMLTQTAAPVAAPTASLLLAWRQAAISTPPIRANTLDLKERATGATCRYSRSMLVAKLPRPLPCRTSLWPS